MISTSGNSENVLKAFETARKNDVMVIGLTGKDSGKLKDFCDVEIHVDHDGYADRIQEIHIKVSHCLVMLVEKILNKRSDAGCSLIGKLNSNRCYIIRLFF